MRVDQSGGERTGDDQSDWRGCHLDEYDAWPGLAWPGTVGGITITRKELSDNRDYADN